MQKQFVVSAVGSKRPGIVAEVSEMIYRCGCQLEDSRMTMLGEHFALLILLSGDKQGLTEELSRGCRRLQREKDLVVFLFPLTGHRPVPEDDVLEPNYEIRVKGRSKRETICRTSRLLASRSVNILDLETQNRSADEGLILRAEILVPKTVDGSAFRQDLARLADELQVEISLSRMVPQH